MDKFKRVVLWCEFPQTVDWKKLDKMLEETIYRPEIYVACTSYDNYKWWSREIKKQCRMIKEVNAFNVVVFPEDVPPDIRIFILYSIRSHKYASISGLSVLNESSCEGVHGVVVNFLIVNVGPLLVMSFVYVAFTLLPSGRLPSRIGEAYEICFPLL